MVEDKTRAGEGFICPNCECYLMTMTHMNKDCGEFGFNDVYECRDCCHIRVLDWKSDSEEDLKLNYPNQEINVVVEDEE